MKPRRTLFEPAPAALDYKYVVILIAGRSLSGDRMKAYRVAGTFLLARKRQPFTKEVEADDETAAVEWVYSVLGSDHRLKRRQISVNEVVEISEDEMDRGRRRQVSTEEE